VTARSDRSLVEMTARSLGRGLADAGIGGKGTLSGLGDRLQGVTVEVGLPGLKLGAAFTGGGDPDADLELDDLMAIVGRLVVEEGGRGVLLNVDELHEAAAEDLKTFAYAAQHLESDADRAPVAVLAAGLPSLPETLMSAATFAERFEYLSLGRLTPSATELALSGPARNLGVGWAPDAMGLAVHSSAGYPHMVQLQGHETWAAATPDPGAVITIEHVRAGVSSAIIRSQGMFRGRWMKATPLEQEFLFAMAAQGEGPVERSTIATAMGRSTGALGVARAALIDKGLVEPTGHGVLEFTTPGFAEFIRQQSLPDSPS
jgi:hypothetical protein